MHKPTPQFITDCVDDYLHPYLAIQREEQRHRAKPTRSYTERKLAQVIRWIKRDGRGQGRGESYAPWIPITKGFSSPVSYQLFAALSIHRRNHHFLSKLEHHTGLQLAYLGATEVRECLPMWPTEHVHPLHDDPYVRATGLLEIAEQAGIEHGSFIGCDVPYIASLDIMAMLPWDGKLHYLGVSCKPDAIMQSSSRARERVALDALYCHAIETPHIHESGSSFNPVLLKNLEDYRPTREEIHQLGSLSQLADYCSHLNEIADGLPLHQAITEAGNIVGVQGPLAACFWRVGSWVHLIDIDLGCRVSMLQPMRRGGAARRASIARHFLGEEA